MLYTVQNTPRHFRYYLSTGYDIFFFLLETDRDEVWYPMQQVVTLQWIPNVSYTSNQTYKNLLVKRKKCSSQMETK